MTVYAAAQALLNGGEARGGLVATVFRLDPQKGPVYFADTTVSMVDYASQQLYPLPALAAAPAGRYIIQLTRPDGGIDTRDFEISEGARTDIRFHISHEGPQEFTALEAMQGSAPGAGKPDDPEANARARGVVSIPTYHQLRGHPESGYGLSLLQGSQRLNSGQGATHWLAEMIAADISMASAGHHLNDPGPLQQPTIENDGYIKFEFVYQGLLGNGAAPDHYYFGPGTELERHYLLQQHTGGATLICLPTPWMSEDGEVPISLLLDCRTLSQAFDYSITVVDPFINNILGYINAGAIRQATQLIPVDRARDMLFSKMSRPLESAIGGYLLLFGQDKDLYRASSDKWQDWTENLDHWFEWLPDGAIINAARFFKLRSGNEVDSYEALMRSYDRGLPFFTFGLKLMLEGMRYFKREGDDKAAERLQHLQTIAMRTDPSKPFLAIDVARWS